MYTAMAPCWFIHYRIEEPNKNYQYITKQLSQGLNLVMYKPKTSKIKGGGQFNLKSDGEEVNKTEYFNRIIHEIRQIFSNHITEEHAIEFIEYLIRICNSNPDFLDAITNEAINGVYQNMVQRDVHIPVFINDVYSLESLEDFIQLYFSEH